MIKGKVTVKLGDNINTDYIIPSDLLQESWDSQFFADHAFEKYDPSFVKICRENKRNIVVAGENFGCGSSREQAVYAIKYNNVDAVVAESFPDIFYRNALNNGLAVIKVKDTSGFRVGDEVTIDLEQRVIKNHTRGEEHPVDISNKEVGLIVEGGLLGIARKRLREQLHVT